MTDLLSSLVPNFTLRPDGTLFSELTNMKISIIFGLLVFHGAFCTTRREAEKREHGNEVRG